MPLQFVTTWKPFVSMQSTWVLNKTNGIGSIQVCTVVPVKLRNYLDSTLLLVTMVLANSVGSSLTLNLSANILQSLPPKDHSVALPQQIGRKRIQRVDSKNKKVPQQN